MTFKAVPLIQLPQNLTATAIERDTLREEFHGAFEVLEQVKEEVVTTEDDAARGEVITRFGLALVSR